MTARTARMILALLLLLSSFAPPQSQARTVLEGGWVPVLGPDGLSKYWKPALHWGLGVEFDVTPGTAISLRYFLDQIGFDQPRFLNDNGLAGFGLKIQGAASEVLGAMAGIRHSVGGGTIRPYAGGSVGLAKLDLREVSAVSSPFSVGYGVSDTKQTKIAYGLGAGIDYYPPRSSIDFFAEIDWLSIESDPDPVRMLPLRLGMAVRSGVTRAQEGRGNEAPRRRFAIEAGGAFPTRQGSRSLYLGDGVSLGGAYELPVVTHAACVLRAGYGIFPFDRDAYRRADHLYTGPIAVEGDPTTMATVTFGVRLYPFAARGIDPYAEAGFGRTAFYQRYAATGSGSSGSFYESKSGVEGAYLLSVGAGLRSRGARRYGYLIHADRVWILRDPEGAGFTTVKLGLVFP